MTSKSKDTSQYLSTPVNNWYLDIWVPRSIEKNDFDKIVTISAEFDRRPDLMSQAEYGTPKLWWMFSVRNPDLLIDPIADFVAGLEIYIPTNILG